MMTSDMRPNPPETIADLFERNYSIIYVKELDYIERVVLENNIQEKER